ncbi:MAG: hypothetical protein V2J02_17285 [Pseudomonadales bacterium]|jgi:hypothetical protein|nr:hypothetical protein [Pseudomonadales bacterium]
MSIVEHATDAGTRYLVVTERGAIVGDYEHLTLAIIHQMLGRAI